MVPECLVPTVLNFVHDTVVIGHPGKERTLAAARAVYFWPTMRVDTDAHVHRCVKCAQHKGTVPIGLHRFLSTHLLTDLGM